MYLIRGSVGAGALFLPIRRRIQNKQHCTKNGREVNEPLPVFPSLVRPSMAESADVSVRLTLFLE